MVEGDGSRAERETLWFAEEDVFEKVRASCVHLCGGSISAC